MRFFALATPGAGRRWLRCAHVMSVRFASIPERVMHFDRRTWIAVVVLSVVAVPSAASLAAAQDKPRPLESFRSYSEVSRYLKHVVEEQNRWTQAGIAAAEQARQAEALSCKPPDRTAGGT